MGVLESEAFVKPKLEQLKPSFTVAEAIESSGFHKFQWILCAISGLSWIATATEIMLFSVMSPSLECEWQVSSVEQALSTTFVFLGWMVASPIWGRICDVRGRRQGLMIASLVGFIFGILTALAPTFYMFLGARFGVGFAIGALAQSVTLTSEFLPAANRARWLIVLKCFWAIGAVIEAAMAMFVLPTMGWRWLVTFSALPLALFGVCSWWLPESVRFHVAQGRVVEARATLERIARFNGCSLPEGELVAETEEPSKGMLDLLKSEHRRTTITVWIIWCLFGLLYIGLAIYTSLLLHTTNDHDAAPENFTIANITGDEPVTLTGEEPCKLLTTDNYMDIIVTTFSEVPGYILIAFAIDLIGRKATFAVGFGIFSICSATMIFDLPRFLIITALFIGRSAIGAVWQAGYIYTSEVYPTPLRAQGLGMASSWGRVGAMTTPIITQMLASVNLIFPAVFYTVGGVLGVILSILLPVETSERVKKSKIKSRA